MQYIGLVFIIIGLFFFLGGVVGIIRLPDAYSRLHASGKVGTVGLYGLIIGVAFIVPSAAPKLLVLAGFFIIIAPVATHTIARSVSVLSTTMGKVDEVETLP